MKKKLLYAVLFSMGFMAFLLLRVEWGHFSLIAGRLSLNYLIPACIVFILGNFVRAIRFCKLDHMDKKLNQWWNINAFYNIITATLPGGAGEAATAYTLKRFSSFNLLSAFRILLLSRLLDLFAISALFLFAAIMISSVTPYREAAIWISGALLFISLITLMPASEQFIMRLLQKLPGNSALIKKILERLSELIKIAEEQRSNNSFVTTLFQSVVMMIAGGISMYLVLQSFGVDFTPTQSFYCYGVYFVFQIVPVQGIAGIGTQAAWWALALKAAGYHAPDAVALGFVLHGTFYLFITIIGVSALLIWYISRKTG